MKKFYMTLFYFLVAVLSLLTADQHPPKIIMEFDDSSLRKIYLHPEAIVEDFDRFWETDEAYKLVKRIHRNNNLTIQMEKWQQKIRGIAASPPEQRTKNKGFDVAREIMGYEQKFIEEGIPHLKLFLPDTTREFSKKIYLTSEIDFRCFMTNGNVVVNVNAAYFQGDSEGIMNGLVHEVFHIGYGFNRYCRSEIPLENDLHYAFLDALQNEGIATYVGYTAQKIFKNRHEKDFRMMDDDEEFIDGRAKLNRLFGKALAGEKNLQPEAWDLGVTQRAYYIVGGNMARTIDRKLGRRALIDTISKGPRSFVSVYNSLAPEKRKIMEFPLPEKLSTFQKLRSALLENRREEYNSLKEELKKDKNISDAKLPGNLNNLGYAMIYKKRVEDAIDVFSLATLLFPNDANAFDSLGEAYMLNDDAPSAIKNYKKSLAINPNNTNAEQMLKKLTPR